jgi:hypothetical protein
MNFILSIEFISLIVIIALTMLFKLHKRLISLVLYSVKIFLPPGQSDFDMIKELKRQKNNPASGIMRSCSVMEYLDGAKDENLMDIDLIVFFYTACFLNIICVEVYKGIVGYSNYMENITNGTTDDTVTSSFAFITIIYVIFAQYKQTFRKGFWAYDAKVFYGLFVTFLMMIGSMYYFNFDQYIVTIDYTKICEFLNNRYERVLNEAGTNKDHVLCTNGTLKVFNSVVFSAIMAYLFRPCCRVSYFDNIMISEEESFSEGSLKTISLLCKLKVIITSFLLFVFVNTLFKNQILKSFPVLTDYEYKLAIIPLFLLAEFIVNFILIKYYANLFHLRNYYEMLEFCGNPDEKVLPYLKYRMNSNNSFFWECFMNIFYITFLPVMVYLYYINRTGLLFVNKNVINTFLEGFSYLLLTALVIAKSIFSTGYLVYLQSSIHKKILI